VAELLRRQNDLAVLRIRLHRAGGWARGSERSTVAFEFQTGSGAAEQLGEVPVSALGLGKTLTGAERQQAFALPATIAGQVAAAAVGQPTLWLEFPSPTGYLRLVPWEGLLAPHLNAAVLRLPYFALLPRAAGRTFQLAVVASAARAKEPFDAVDLIGALLDAVFGPDVRVHVFCDAESYGEVSHMLDQHERVQIYDPAHAAEFDLPRRTRQIEARDEVQNPWLRWVARELRARALDGIHFIAHGYYAQDRGAIALASSPLVNTDRQYARFVGAAELGAFLTATGAWTVGFTGPVFNFAPLGLRELADSLAQTRPLHVLHHESQPETDELREAYGLMRSTEPRPAPRLRNSALWVHPHLVSEPYETAAGHDAWLDDAGRTVLLGSSTEEALAGEETPTWVAAGTRAIEQIHGGLLGSLAADRSPPLDAVSGADVEFALREAADLLDRHVRAAKDPSA